MSVSRAYFKLHIAVILLAFTAILGDLVQLSPGVLIWWRTLFASLGLIVYLLLFRKLRTDWILQKKKLWYLGIIVGVHWLCFFGSIKLANASTALICFATITLFTAWTEPWITGKKMVQHEMVFGLLIIPGILLIAGKAEGHVLLGIILGIIGAFLVALLSSFEKKWLIEVDPPHMTLIQMMSAWVLMNVWVLGELIFSDPGPLWPTGIDWVYMLILGVICTSIAWVLAAGSLLTVSAFDSLMVINLEPVYGILMALVLLDDRKELTPRFYIGASIILATVIIHPLWQRRYARK